ncbi:hypothetical protein [Microbacterium sp. PA5]|uniref:hypothetical protein n=1 Tax=Microbacterium sp. PA5 TaxID=3416654 RepID=UPI003CE74206
MTTPNKPWYKRIPWWGWAAAVVVLLIIGGIQNLVNPAPAETPAAETPAAVAPEEPAAPADEPDSDLPVGEVIAKHVAKSLGYRTLDAACEDQVRWACNVYDIEALSETELRVVVTEPHEEVMPLGIASGFYNFVTGPLDDGTASPLPDLKKVIVADTSGAELAVKD